MCVIIIEPAVLDVTREHLCAQQLTEPDQIILLSSGITDSGESVGMKLSLPLSVRASVGF